MNNYRIEEVIKCPKCLEVAKKIKSETTTGPYELITEIANLFDSTILDTKDENELSMLYYYYAIVLEMFLQPKMGLTKIDDFKKDYAKAYSLHKDMFDELCSDLEKMENGLNQ